MSQRVCVCACCHTRWWLSDSNQILPHVRCTDDVAGTVTLRKGKSTDHFRTALKDRREQWRSTVYGAQFLLSIWFDA